MLGSWKLGRLLGIGGIVVPGLLLGMVIEVQAAASSTAAETMNRRAIRISSETSRACRSGWIGAVYSTG